MTTSFEEAANTGDSDFSPPPSYTESSTTDDQKHQQTLTEVKRESCSCHAVYNALKLAIQEMEARDDAARATVLAKFSRDSLEKADMAWRIKNTAKIKGIIRIPSDVDRCNCHSEYSLLKTQIEELWEVCEERRKQYKSKDNKMTTEEIRWYEELEADVLLLMGMLRECDGGVKPAEKWDKIEELKAEMKELKLKLKEMEKSAK